MRRTAEPCGHIALLAPGMNGRTGSVAPAGDEARCRGELSSNTKHVSHLTLSSAPHVGEEALVIVIAVILVLVIRTITTR